MASRLHRVWSTMIGRNSPEQPDAPPLIDEEHVDRTSSSAEVSEEPSATAPRYSSSRPDLESFERFLDDVKASFPEKEYRWTKGKSRSSKWILDRVPAGWRGVDVGGTEYLCKKLAEKGCKATFFDIGAPEDYGDYIQDDMINILRHFEEKSLDFITTRHTLEHSLMPLFQLWAYNRLLKDDGRLFVIVPIHNERWVWYPTHFNCLPYENWLMLFYRAGFKVEEHDAGTWSVTRPDFIEYRFSLSVQSRELRLAKGRR